VYWVVIIFAWTCSPLPPDPSWPKLILASYPFFNLPHCIILSIMASTLKLQSITRKNQQCSVIGKIEHRLPSPSFTSFKIWNRLPRRPLHGGRLCRQEGVRGKYLPIRVRRPKEWIVSHCFTSASFRKNDVWQCHKTFATEEFNSIIPATCLCSRVRVGRTAPTSVFATSLAPAQPPAAATTHLWLG
jgi:hypothetical protein